MMFAPGPSMEICPLMGMKAPLMVTVPFRPEAKVMLPSPPPFADAAEMASRREQVDPVAGAAGQLVATPGVLV